MRGNQKILITAIVLIAVVVIALFIAVPSIQRSFFYPKPSSLPPVVQQSTEALLARVQSVLESNAQPVAAVLQPGLTDSQITSLETEGGFHLSDDLRMLYRWHNGIAASNVVGFLPGQRFLPLEEVVNARAITRRQISSATMMQRVAVTVFARHRESWIQIMDDGAGDGYFFDPKRAESDGAFFYHFTEEGYYIWFPSLRNFLSGVAECYETQSVKLKADGKGLDENVEQTQKIWSRLSTNSETTH